MNAELWEQAVTYLRQAGNKAVELSAYREASAFFEKALEALKQLPQDREHLLQEIDIRLSLRAIFGATAEYSRLEDRLDEAEALAISINDQPQLAAIYVAKTFASNLRGDVHASIRSGVRARAIAREIGDSGLGLAASYYLGQAYMWRGEFRRSLDLFADNADVTSGPLRHQRLGTTGTSSVLWFGMAAASHAYLGDFPEALAAGREACAIADEVRRPYDIALAYWYAGFVSSHKGDLSAALTSLEHSFEVCRARQINFLIPIIATSLGYTHALKGQPARGIELLTQAMEATRAARFYYGEAWATTYLGFACILDGRNEGVLERAHISIELARAHGYRAIEAASLRLMAEALRHGGARDWGAAERYYLEACDISQELGMRPDQAHCQRGLAQLYVKLSREQEADRLRRSAEDIFKTLDMTVPEERV